MAVHFENGGNRVNYGSFNRLGGLPGRLTIALTLDLQAPLPSTGRLVSEWDASGANSSFLLTEQDGNELGLLVKNNTGAGGALSGVKTNTLNLTSGTLYRIAFVLDAQTRANSFVWANGVRYTTVDWQTGVVNNMRNSSGEMTIGAQYSASVVPTGDFSHVAIIHGLWTEQAAEGYSNGVSPLFYRDAVQNPADSRMLFYAPLWSPDAVEDVVEGRPGTNQGTVTKAYSPSIISPAAGRILVPVVAPAPGVNLVVLDLASTNTVDAAAVSQTHVLAEQDLVSVNTVDAAAVSQTHVLAEQDLVSVNTVDAVAIVGEATLTAQDLSSVLTVEASTVVQTHVTVPQDLASQHTVDAVTLESAGTLTVEDLSSVNTIDAATVAQTHVLSVQDLASQHVVESTVVHVDQTLAAADLVAVHTVESTQISADKILVAGDISSVFTVDAAQITSQTHIVVPAELVARHTVEPAAVAQTHNLSMQDLVSRHSVTQTTIFDVFLGDIQTPGIVVETPQRAVAQQSPVLSVTRVQ